MRTLLLAALLASAPAMASEAMTSAQDQESDFEVRYCNAAISTPLPGDYNLCLGIKYWQAGKYDAAREMLELSSGWGSKVAQRLLGIAYFNGDGLAENRPLGLAWLAMSAERKDPTAAMLYNSALDKSSRQERQAAFTLFQQLQVRYSDSVAATRADRRFQRSILEMRSNPVYGRGKCLAGAGGFPTAAAADMAADGAGNCSMAADDRFIAALEQRYEEYSAGWSRRVELGAPQTLPRN